MYKKIIYYISFFLFAIMNAAYAENHDLSVSTLENPIPVQTTRHHMLVYELHFFNSGSQTLSVDRIEVFGDDNQPVLQLSGNRLIRNALVYKNGKHIQAGSIELKKNTGAFVYILIPFKDHNKIPAKLHHKIWIAHADEDLAHAAYQVISHDVMVNKEKLPVLGMPLKGYNWVAEAAISNDSYHRRAILPIDDKFYLAQRFAIDWVQICPDGKEVHGNMHENQNWNAFGHDVLAVDDGIVTKMQDVIPQNNIPPGLPNPPPNLVTTPGNFVILKIEQNNKHYYVFYGHMQPGSIKVKTGDRVTKGQVIGLLGNTGNSSQPHLHMHVCSGNDPLKCDGMPFVFRNMTLQGLAGAIDMNYGLWKPPAGKTQTFNNVIPAENQIIHFSNDNKMKCK